MLQKAEEVKHKLTRKSECVERKKKTVKKLRKILKNERKNRNPKK